MTSDLYAAKWRFIEHEVMALAIQGAFHRANVYDPTALDESKREELRHRLASLLRDFASQYVSPVTEEQHKINITKIADDLSSEFSGRGILYKDRFRIGIVQKALNPYLKYLWCLDKVAR